MIKSLKSSFTMSLMNEGNINHHEIRTKSYPRVMF